MQLAKQLEDKLGNKLIICTTSALPVLNEFLTAYKQLASQLRLKMIQLYWSNDSTIMMTVTQVEAAIQAHKMPSFHSAKSCTNRGGSRRCQWRMTGVWK